MSVILYGFEYTKQNRDQQKDHDANPEPETGRDDG